MLDKKTKIKKILATVNLIAFIIFLLLTLIMGGAVISSSAVNDDLNLFGYNFILTKDLTGGDETTFVVTKKFDLKDINQSEIILYKLKDNDVSMFAKLQSKTNSTMVVENIVNKKIITIETDNMETISCIRFTSKTLGEFVQFIQTPKGLIVFVSCAAGLLLLVLISTILVHIKFERALKEFKIFNHDVEKSELQAENNDSDLEKLQKEVLLDIKTNLEKSEDFTNNYIAVDKNLPKIHHIIEFQE